MSKPTRADVLAGFGDTCLWVAHKAVQLHRAALATGDLGAAVAALGLLVSANEHLAAVEMEMVEARPAGGRRRAHTTKARKR